MAACLACRPAAGMGQCLRCCMASQHHGRMPEPCRCCCGAQGRSHAASIKQSWAAFHRSSPAAWLQGALVRTASMADSRQMATSRTQVEWGQLVLLGRTCCLFAKHTLLAPDSGWRTSLPWLQLDQPWHGSCDGRVYADKCPAPCTLPPYRLMPVPMPSGRAGAAQRAPAAAGYPLGAVGAQCTLRAQVRRG